MSNPGDFRRAASVVPLAPGRRDCPLPVTHATHSSGRDDVRTNAPTIGRGDVLCALRVAPECQPTDRNTVRISAVFGVPTDTEPDLGRNRALWILGGKAWVCEGIGAGQGLDKIGDVQGLPLEESLRNATLSVSVSCWLVCPR